MTTTDTDALTERIARALSEHWRDMHTNEALGQQRMLAAAVLPIVAEEVRKAKAEALREAAEWAERGLGWVSGGRTNTDSVRYWLRERAAEYETGEQR